jgi:hypothetical protein
LSVGAIVKIFAADTIVARRCKSTGHNAVISAGNAAHAHRRRFGMVQSLRSGSIKKFVCGAVNTGAREIREMRTRSLHGF